jgi:SPW repeat
VNAPDVPAEQRHQLLGARGAYLVLGLWLIAAPFVLGYARGDRIWNDVVCGVIVTAVGALALVRDRDSPALTWVNAAVGMWLILAAYVLAASATAAWSDVVVGLTIFMLALLSAAASDAGP